MSSNQSHYTRSLIHYWDEEGNLVIKVTLPPEQGALVLKALAAATESLQQDDRFNGQQGVDEDITEDSTADTRDAASRSSTEEKSAEHVSAETSDSQQSHSHDRTFDSIDDAHAIPVDTARQLVAQFLPANKLVQ